MRIKIISVGKLKEKYLTAGIAEYVKRLSRFGQVEIVELADEKKNQELELEQEKLKAEFEGSARKNAQKQELLKKRYQQMMAKG